MDTSGGSGVYSFQRIVDDYKITAAPGQCPINGCRQATPFWVVTTAHAHHANTILIEDTGVGTALVSELENVGLPVIAVKPQQSKQIRVFIQSLASFIARSVAEAEAEKGIEGWLNDPANRCRPRECLHDRWGSLPSSGGCMPSPLLDVCDDPRLQRDPPGGGPVT